MRLRVGHNTPSFGDRSKTAILQSFWKECFPILYLVLNYDLYVPLDICLDLVL